MNKVTSVDVHPTVVRDSSETIFDGIAYLGLQYALYVQGCGSAFTLFLCGPESSIFPVLFQPFYFLNQGTKTSTILLLSNPIFYIQ
jgi:hypothetical protein